MSDELETLRWERDESRALDDVKTKALTAYSARWDAYHPHYAAQAALTELHNDVQSALDAARGGR